MKLYQTFRIYFQILRFFGSFPYTICITSYSKNPNSPEKIRFIFLSKSAVWFGLIFILKLSVFYFSTFDLASLIEVNKYVKDVVPTRTYEGFVLETLKQSLNIHFIFHTIFSLFGIKSTENLFALWDEFDKKFQAITIRPLRKGQILKGRILILVMFIWLCCPSISLIIGGSMLSQASYSDINPSVLYFLVIMFMINFSPHLDDFKCLIYIYFIQHCFNEVEHDIKIRLPKKLTTKSQLFLIQRDESEKLVQRWHELVVILNEITKQTGNILGYSQIFSIGHELFVVTVSTYSLLQFVPQLNGTSEHASFFYFGILAAGFYGSKMFIKCYVCQLVNNEETRLVRQLEKIDTSQLSPEAKFEVRYFIDCVQNHPSVTCLSGYFCLDLSFFLKMVGTLMTYLVVLVQFKDMFIITS